MALLSWKFKRELSRIQSQIQGWLTAVIEPYLRRQHDIWLAKTKPACGGCDSSRRVAIFLLHQPSGISQSTIESCQFLTACGFAVLLVSNAPVCQEDQEKLTPWFWRLIERPNFGYDFGGYRDAVHWLWTQTDQVDQLLMVNDSIWFPVLAHDPNAWLHQLCEHPSSFCGIMELAGHRTEHRRRRRKSPFLGSFFLLFKNDALKSPSFIAFWKNYKMTSNKNKTIRRGERGISAAMDAAGFKQHAHFRREMLDDLIAQANSLQLMKILKDLNAFDDTLKTDQRHLLQHFQDTQEWAEQARATIYNITNLQNLLVTAPLICIEQFELPILKKARTHQNLTALRSVYKASTEGRFELNGSVAGELRYKLQAAEN